MELRNGFKHLIESISVTPQFLAGVTGVTASQGTGLTRGNIYVTLRNMTGQEVRRLRVRLKLKQAELADKMGVSRVTIARWETGQHGIRESAARLLRMLVEQSKGQDNDQTST